MSMRIRGAKTELEEAGESTDGMAESTASLRAEMKALSGVDIMLDSNTFKSTYQIMDELSRKWKDLSDIQQATIIELVAGKHQGNIFSALMANFDTARAALDTSLHSSGSAMTEHAKWSESLEARLNKLKAAWQSLSQTFMNSSFLKVSMDAITGLVNVLDKLLDSLGSFGTIGLGAGIYGIVKNFGTSKSLTKNIFTALTTNAMDSYDAFTKWSKASDGVVSGGKALAKSMSAVTGAIGLTVAVIGLVYNAYKNAKEAAAEARQEVIQASDEYLNAASTFEQAYIKYSGKTDLTSEEEEELASAINGTVDALGDKSSALQSIVSGSNDYLASLEAIKKAELEAAASAAMDKRNNAAESLKEVAIGWESWDGSEVDISIAGDKAAKIAKEMGGNFYESYNASVGREENYESFKLKLSGDADTSEIISYYNTLLNFKEELKNAGLEDSTDYKNVETAIGKMSDSIGLYVEGVYEAVKANYQLNEGIPKTTEQYIAMREAILTDSELSSFSVSQKMGVLNSLDSEYGKLFNLSSVEAQARKFVGIIKGFGDGTIDGTDEIGTVETFLNMRTAVNNNECTVGQYLSELDNVKAMSTKFSDEEQKEFNLAFGLNTDSIKEQYDDVYNYLSRNYLENLDFTGLSGFDAQQYARHEEQKIKDILNGLSATELQAVANIKGEINWETANRDEILAQIKEEAKFVEAMNFTIAIDVETESLNALNTAMSESVSGAGLSSEAITALKGRYAELESQGYDLSAMFEETANGIHLNRDAVSELEQALASQKLSETKNNLDKLTERYNELTDEINNCTEAGERAGLYREQQSILQKINDLGTLASQYEGLTSAYNAWQSAESAGQERDMYESVIEGFENIGDEISRGWYDDGTIKFLELMTGRTDLAGESAKKLKEIWNGLDDKIKNTSYSVKDFFTVDEEGNTTSTGVYNFLRALQELESSDTVSSVLGKQFKDIENIEDLVTVKDGKITAFNFDVVGGDEAIAEALGISEELVQIMVRAADDAGFVVTLEGNWTQFADLKEQAENANDAIKKLAQTNDKLKNAGFGEYEFNFGANTVEEVNVELDKAKELLNNPVFKKDGKFNIEAEGAKDALKIAETLQIAKSKLEQPAYMSVDTSKLQKELQEPVKLLQEYETLTQEKDLLNLTGTDTKRLGEIDVELGNIADKLSKLPDETKIDLGIDGMTPAQIREELENGTIEVPAELTIEANMDKSLQDLVTLGLLEQGLIDEKTAKIRLGLEVEVDETGTADVEKTIEQKVSEITSKPIISNAVVNISNLISEYTPEEQEVVLKYLADTSEYDNFEAEDKEAVVKFIADSFDVDKYTPEEKEAYAKYIADGGNLDAYTPAEKEAIVKYLVNGDDINNYDPDDKEAITKFLANTVDVDNYTPEQKEAIAKFIKDSLDVDNYQMPTNKWAYAKYIKDTNDIDGWTPPVKEGGIAEYSPSLLSYSLPTLSGGIAYYTAKISGSGEAAGTANANGTAFAGGTTGVAFRQGDWGTKRNGVALGGELGQELIVRDGKFFTIGDKGAEFFHYKKDDIIFNAAQTASLFKYGGIKGANPRGKALAGGTAFASGTAFADGTAFANGSNTSLISKLKDIFIKVFIDKNSIDEQIAEIRQRIINGLNNIQIPMKTTTGVMNWTTGSVEVPAVEGTVNYSVGDIEQPDSGDVTVEGQTSGGAIEYSNIVPDVPTGLEGSGVVNYTNNVPAPPTGLQGSGVIVYSNSVPAPPSGGGGAAGTAWNTGSAFANGVAFKQGSWGTNDKGVALGGELGRELIVRNGRFFTIGDKGAEFFHYKKNDIIFNAAQTESLFKYGGIKGANPRGRAIASGTAFSVGQKNNYSLLPEKSGLNASGNITINSVTINGQNVDLTDAVVENLASGENWWAPNAPYRGGSSGSGGDDSGDVNIPTYTGDSGNSSDKDDDNDFEEKIDWIEIAIDRIERAIDQLDKKANNIYRSWSERNSNLVDEISKINDEIVIQEQAYDRYMEAANGVGLESSWAELVRNGKIDISTITDEDLKTKIDEYRKYYEAALDCQNAVLDLKEAESELYAQRLENVSTQYEGILGVIEHEKNMLEEYINQSETQAWLVSSQYYDALMSNERENIAELQNQKASMLAEFDAAMESGTIVEGSEAWYEMVNSIDEVTLAIAESQGALLEYEQTLQQLDFKVFDLLQEQISAVTKEAEFLIDLLSSDKLHEDNGQLTNEGKATMGLHGQNYNILMHQADQAAAEAEKLRKELEEDPYDTELESRYREMIALQQEYILAAQDEKEAIRDLVEEGIELELDALDERIEKYEEALDSQRDLYDYQKKTEESVKNIASLEKQLSSYQGFDDEETKAKVQQLKVKLEDAKSDLEESQYDKYMSDQSALLDELSTEYSELLNTRLDNIDYLVEQMITEINADASVIGDTIRDTADSVGYTLSDSMKTIWDENSVNIQNVVTTYGDKFVNAQTTTNSALNAINTNLQNMINQLDSKAKANTKSASTSSVAKSSSSNKTTTTTVTTKKSGGDGTPKIGDRVKFVNGQYYYDSQGKKPLGSHNQGEYVYITNINKKDWATHPYHISTGSKLGKGDLGWLKLNQISGYADGKEKFFNDEIAWTQEGSQEFIVRPSDGAILTPVAKGDSILTSAASKNIWDMANSPVEFIKDNLNLCAAHVPNNSTVSNSITQHFDNIVFSMPNVKNYGELLSELQKDPKFDKLVKSMTIDQIAGKSSLGKGKSIR